MKQKILIVEDDPAILIGLVDLCQAEGYNVVYERNGAAAIRLYEQENPDLILLDIMIPEKNGYDVCREIRKKDMQTPILMLTAKSEEVDKVVGLEIGADDYIVKPFGVKELLARIHAILRRTNNKETKKDNRLITFGDVTIDPKTLKGTKGKRQFSVSRREVKLLQLFMQHDAEVMDRGDILSEVWGINYAGTTRTLDQHIVKLRQKIENNLANPQHIKTVHGVGYQFFK
ncbi:MAG: response regulator transcription factor [Candidatus Omnitrophota bacterium]